MTYITFALLAAICFSLSLVVSKLASKHSIDNPDSLISYFLLTSLFLLPFLAIIAKPTLPNPNTLFLIFITQSTFIIGYYYFYKGIFTTDASSFAPLFQLQAILIAILAYLFLGETFPASNYLWGILIITGAILVNYNENTSLKAFMQKGTFFILIMQVFHSISNLFIGITLKQINFLQLAFWGHVYIFIFGLTFILIKKPKLNYKKAQILPVIIASILGGIGGVFLFKAFSTNLTISSLIALLSSPIVFIISIIASKFAPQLLEHHSSKVYLVRGIGIAIILLSAIKIATT